MTNVLGRKKGEKNRKLKTFMKETRQKVKKAFKIKIQKTTKKQLHFRRREIFEYSVKETKTKWEILKTAVERTKKWF